MHKIKTVKINEEWRNVLGGSSLVHIDLNNPVDANTQISTNSLLQNFAVNPQLF